MVKSTVVVIGMGEIGRPLYEILSRTYPTLAVDIQPEEPPEYCSALHICYPFQVPDFLGTTADYIAKYRPELTIINSTVLPGTTRKVQQGRGSAMVYSPVRGKHSTMEQDILRYKKFLAGIDPKATAAAVEHFQRAGITTDTFRSPEVGELAKLLETTWLGVLVGWTQEMERLGAEHGATFSEVNAFMKEISYVPSVFPGFIGGHCVMPNIALLKCGHNSQFLDAVEAANESKAHRISMAERKAA